MGALCPRRGGGERGLLLGPAAKGGGDKGRVGKAAQDGMCGWQGRHYMCQCHVSLNFFVRSVGQHLEYDGDDDAFARRYAAQLDAATRPPAAGSAAAATTLRDVLADVRRQRLERLTAPVEAASRAERIAREYRPRERGVYALDPAAFLAGGFREAATALRGARPLDAAAGVAALRDRGLLQEVRAGLFVFEAFTAEFCDLLEAELAHFAASGLPSAAPNTMNRHGVILSELGLADGLVAPLVRDWIDPLAAVLLPEHTRGLDSFRAFTVLYEAADGGDRDLALHYDNAEVTLNINIGGDWSGGEIEFHGLATEPEVPGDVPAVVPLRRGWGVLHAGLDLHRARPIDSGRRHNLVIWCRSSGVRNQRCPMCLDEPRVLPTNRFGAEGFSAPPCRLSDAAWEPGVRELFA